MHGFESRWLLDADTIKSALQNGARLPSECVTLNPACSQISEVNLLEGLQNGAFWSGGDGGGSIYTVNTASACSWLLDASRGSTTGKGGQAEPGLPFGLLSTGREAA